MNEGIVRNKLISFTQTAVQGTNQIVKCYKSVYKFVYWNVHVAYKAEGM